MRVSQVETLSNDLGSGEGEAIRVVQILAIVEAEHPLVHVRLQVRAIDG
jgi:hypothetical protein